ncbi:ATP-binding protein [Candidatus Nomurabacteria bacterium]|nr:ATP-binding protein [Candidatus Nomurabacteria bacterium]
MKIVITGTTCAGKSTTLDLLAKRGFEVVPESALEIINEQNAIGGDILPTKNVKKFQEAILDRQLEKESELTDEKNYFLDRSIVDQFGYCNFFKIDCPQKVFDLAKERYDKVFLLEPLDFIDNRFEHESREDQLNIDIEIRKAYEHFGYEYILVPLDKPEKRVEFVLNNI